MKKQYIIIILTIILSSCSSALKTWDKNNWENEKGNTFYLDGVSLKGRTGLGGSYYKVDSKYMANSALSNFPVDKLAKVISEKYNIKLNVDSLKKSMVKNNIPLQKKNVDLHKKYKKISKSKEITTDFFWVSPEIEKHQKRVFLHYIVHETTVVNHFLHKDHTDPKLLITCFLTIENNGEIIEKIAYTIPQVELNYKSDGRTEYFQPSGSEEGFELINKEVIKTPEYIKVTIDKFKNN